MANYTHRKTIPSAEEVPEEHRLKKSLTWAHLIFLGVGAIVGTGILVLIGTAADKAGPSMMLSFVIAGVICAAAAIHLCDCSS
jgi:APA family basic amino acid/polyamine antiporter